MFTEVLEKSSTPTSGGTKDLKSLSTEVKKVVRQILKDPELASARDVTDMQVPQERTEERPEIRSSPSGTLMPINPQLQSGLVDFQWDPTCCAQKTALSEGNMSCYLVESGYCFRSVVANTGITEGIAYWEIHGDGRTENELKIGVVSKKNFDFNTVRIFFIV